MPGEERMKLHRCVILLLLLVLTITIVRGGMFIYLLLVQILKEVLNNVLTNYYL